MKKIYFLLFFVGSFLGMGNAQLADGATAPDFTVQDINGNSYTLYDMMGSNKAACLDFMATWCGPCWSFKNSGVLEQVYNNLGAQTTVIMIEADYSTNTNCLYGSTGCNSTTQGNWVTGTPYPITDLSTTNGPSVKSDYSIAFYPTLYVISPDKRAWSIKSRTYFEYENWITKSFKLNATASLTHSSCGDNGKIVLAITGGFGVITYEWSNGATTKDISNLPGGSYSVRVKDQYGYFEDYGPFVVQGPSKRVAVTAANLTNINCYGESTGSIEIQVDYGTSPYKFNWSNGKKTQDITDLPYGNYGVTVTDNNNCTTTKSYVLTQSAEMKLTTTGKAETCDQGNGSILAKATGGVPPFEFDLGNGKQTNPFFDNLKGGTSYSVTATDSKGCFEVSTAFVDITHKPAASAGGDMDITCKSPEITLDGSLSEDGTQILYEWTTLKGRILKGADEKFPLVDLPGTYRLKVKNIINSCEAFDSVIVFDPRVYPEIKTQGDTNINCVNKEVVVNGSSKDADIKLFWKKLGDTSFYNPNPKLISSDSGIFVFHVLDTITLCISKDTVVLIKDIEEPVAAATPEHDLSCTKKQVIIDGSNSSQGQKYSYQWTTKDGHLVSGEQTLFAVVDQKGTYHLEVKNTQNHCKQYAEVIVYQKLPPESSFSEQVNLRLVQFNDLSTGLPDKWQWTFGDGDSSSQQNPTHQYLTDGEFTVCLETQNDCGTQSVCHNILVGIGAALSLSNWEVHHVSCFGGNDGSINIQVVGGVPPYEYSWNHGPTSQNVIDLNAETYQVTVKDQQGTTIKQTFTIKEPSEIKLQSATIIPANPGKNDGQIEVTVNGGIPPYIYKWSNGTQQNPVVQLTPGSYYCTVLDANQCEKVLGPFEVKELVSNDQVDDWLFSQILPNPGAQSTLNYQVGKVNFLRIRIMDALGQNMAILSNLPKNGSLSLNEYVHHDGYYWISIESNKGHRIMQWIRK